jgi:Protein of unknown function (DUF1640)
LNCSTYSRDPGWNRLVCQLAYLLLAWSAGVESYGRIHAPINFQESSQRRRMIEHIMQELSVSELRVLRTDEVIIAEWLVCACNCVIVIRFAASTSSHQLFSWGNSPVARNMATPRLLFLYPNLYRAIRSCEPTTYRSIRTPPAKSTCRKANFHTSRHRAQDIYQSRYGPAASPSLPPPPKPSESLLSRKEQEGKTEAANAVSPKEKRATKADASNASEKAAQTTQRGKAVIDSKNKVEPLKTEESQNSANMLVTIPSPSEIKEGSNKHPHLEASPYEHHFDTYSLVQQLAQDDFTQEQAVTLMKAIRLMLAMNLDIAKESLVSKSDVENETYLFRAACSELRTTLQSARHAETQRQRSTRAQLQHEYDILNQKTTQDLLSMREDLKAMFNERKMALQDEKRRIDGKISDLNYKITVLLNSDSKGEVEGLRWILTRRAAMAIAIAACEYCLSRLFWTS